MLRRARYGLAVDLEVRTAHAGDLLDLDVGRPGTPRTATAMRSANPFNVSSSGPKT